MARAMGLPVWSSAMTPFEFFLYTLAGGAAVVVIFIIVVIVLGVFMYLMENI